jgi:tetraacyldisaccharide 4'-kinase
MINGIEKYVTEVITKKRRGLFAFLVKCCLLLLSCFFRAGVLIRNWLFDQRWLTRYSPPIPVVISVGNIVAGGTGKTPITLMLAREFYDQIPLAVVARGYRSTSEKLSVPTILSHGEGPKRPPEFCGDEPYLIAGAFPKAFVIVGKDRRKASDMAAKFGAQLLLLDDGMQHRRLARDFELVVLDASDPFGYGHFLPRGFLREGVGALKRADLILVNHVHSPSLFEEVRKKVERRTAAPLVGVQVKIDRIQIFKGSASFAAQDGTLFSVKDLKVGAFCAIARPEHFYHTLIAEGALLVDSAEESDHMYFESRRLRAFSDTCKAAGAQLLLCTEKDRVKLMEIGELSLPLASVKTSLSIVAGADQWQQFIAKVKARL